MTIFRAATAMIAAIYAQKPRRQAGFFLTRSQIADIIAIAPGCGRSTASRSTRSLASTLAYAKPRTWRKSVNALFLPSEAQPRRTQHESLLRPRRLLARAPHRDARSRHPGGPEESGPKGQAVRRRRLQERERQRLRSRRQAR